MDTTDKSISPPDSIDRWQNFGIAAIFLAGLAIIFRHWPMLWQKGAEKYVLAFSAGRLLALWACFYGLYALPGLIFLYWKGRRNARNAFFSLHRCVIAFGVGAIAHCFSALLQKNLHLAYSPLVVLFCLTLSYAIVFCLLPSSRLLETELKQEQEQDRRWNGVAAVILISAFLLTLELILRGRVSSTSLMGDAYPHFIGLIATQIQGPMPDGLPFLSTFVMNLQPMAFHALIVSLQTLLDFPTLDALRYFSAVLLPAVVIVFFTFFSWLARNRAVGAMATFALMFVSGGGLSTAVPVVFFPWYWAFAWCLCAAFSYILLSDGLQERGVYFFCGLLLGAAILFHSMVALRMAPILTLFWIFELIRRLSLREELKSFFLGSVLLMFGVLSVVALWAVPLLLKYPWEQTYTYSYIIQNFQKAAPEAVEYVRRLKEERFRWIDLFKWSQSFGGVWVWILAPLGLAGFFGRRRESAASFLLAWILAMGAAILRPYLPNPYRYFEYFFLGLLALNTFGIGWLLQNLPERWRAFALLPFVGLLLFSIPTDFFPKYRLALHYYGQTSWENTRLHLSEDLEARYRRAWKEGTLDREFGTFRGYLWSRQKKVWDIYISNRTRMPVSK